MRRVKILTDYADEGLGDGVVWMVRLSQRDYRLIMAVVRAANDDEGRGLHSFALQEAVKAFNKPDAKVQCVWDGTRENMFQRGCCSCVDCRIYTAEGCGVPG